MLFIGLALLTAGGVGLGGWYFLTRRHVAYTELITQPIKKEKLQITITERGSLESAENNEIACRVKARAQGVAATSIRWVIDNGSYVKEGDRILELDDSALQDQWATQYIAVLNAEKTWREAEQTLAVNLLTNEGEVKTQETELKVAKIILQEYSEGLYETAKIDLENKRIITRSDLSMWSERARWSDRMSRPGRQYVTASQAEADEARRRTAELTRNNIQKQLDVLNALTKKRNQVEFQGNIDKAKRAMEVAQKKRDLDLASNKVGVSVGQAVYEKELSRMREIEREIEYCFIRAPRDGMVVYYVEERARWSSSPAGIIAQGESVKEGQKLLSIPDLKNMVVNARVHEAMVSRVYGDVMKDTGFSGTINTSLLISPRPLSGLSAYTTFQMDLRAPFSNEHRKQEKIRVSRGLDATVRVNAFPTHPLKAHVKSVAAVASQNDFFASDVKVYQTFIAVDETLEGLKPGMDTVVSILVDSSPEPVVQIPLEAVLGTVDMGEKRRCYVMVEGRPQRREITLGMANEKVVEVKDGLKEGDVVVMNPVALLSEKERMEYGNLPAQSGRGGPGMPGGQDGYKDKGKGKGGPGAGGPGMKKGAPGGGKKGAPGGGKKGGAGGPRSQGGASPSGKTAANP